MGPLYPYWELGLNMADNLLGPLYLSELYFIASRMGWEVNSVKYCEEISSVSRQMFESA